MKFDIANLENAIEKAFELSGHEVLITDSNALNDESNFLSVFSALQQKYNAPDYPCYIDSAEWLEVLEIQEKLVAIWDFDYYRLSLRKGGKSAIFTKHDT